MVAGLEHGLDDVEEDGERMLAWCDASDVGELRKALEEADLPVIEANAPMVPASTVPVTEAADAKAILKLLDLLDDNDDVQEVWDNVDIDDDILEQIDA